jgi:hypothetical protein
MPENPHSSLLGREASAAIVAKHYAPQLDLLRQMVNYASNLIPRAFGSSAKQLPDLIVCYVLLKQFASMIDAMEVLIRAGSVHASFVPGRVAFEVSLYLEWMLVSDCEKKALHYYVGNIRVERVWGLRVQKSSPEADAFLKDMGQLGADILTNRPTLDQEGVKHVGDADRILSQPEFAEINAAFDVYRKKSKRPYEPDWYKVLGKNNLKAIARELHRNAEYAIYYSKGSTITHSQSYKDHVSFKSAGVGANPIRSVADIHTAFNFAFTMSMLTFQRVLGFYRNEEMLQFSRMYVAEWRQAFTNILTINIV